MTQPRPSNVKRAQWNRRCREKLSAHIQSRLGILVDPSQVRLKTAPEDLYDWERVADKEHLFAKNISDHSTGVLKELHEGVGVSFAAIGKQTTLAMHPAGEQRTYLQSKWAEPSFTAKISALEEESKRLREEVRQWVDHAAFESERRYEAEEEVSRLTARAKEGKEDNRKLSQHVTEWKIVAEHAQQDKVQCVDGLNQISAILKTLQTQDHSQ